MCIILINMVHSLLEVKNERENRKREESKRESGKTERERGAKIRFRLRPGVMEWQMCVSILGHSI